MQGGLLGSHLALKDFLILSGRIPSQGKAGYRHIKDHKKDQSVAEEFPPFHGNPFNRPGQKGIQYFKPYYRHNTPEKAVEQIDPTAQIKRNGAVIPEYGAENQFGKHTAYIFIGSAQDGACQKDIPVIFLPVRI